jgi:hypothetical protein
MFLVQIIDQENILGLKKSFLLQLLEGTDNFVIFGITI